MLGWKGLIWFRLVRKKVLLLVFQPVLRRLVLLLIQKKVSRLLITVIVRRWLVLQTHSLRRLFVVHSRRSFWRIKGFFDIKNCLLRRTWIKFSCFSKTSLVNFDFNDVLVFLVAVLKRIAFVLTRRTFGGELGGLREVSVGSLKKKIVIILKWIVIYS